MCVRKAREMEEMDEHLGDLHTSIIDREVEILEKLYEEVISREHALLQAAQVFAQLDWYAQISYSRERRAAG